MYAYERPSKEALEETSPKETEPLKPIQAFGGGTVVDTTGLLSMDRILGYGSNAVQMKADQQAPLVRPLDVSRHTVVQREVDLDIVKMGSGFAWSYLQKLMVEHGVDSSIKNIIRNACIYLTDYAMEYFDLSKYLNILGTYVGYLEKLQRAVKLIPKPIWNVILYGIGWGLRQFSVKCLQGYLSERRISQVIMGTSGFLQGIDGVISLLVAIQKPGDLVYKGLAHVMGWDTTTTSKPKVTESDEHDKKDNLINQKTKFFWIRMGSPHLDDWSGGERGGLHMDGSFGARLFGYTMGSEVVDLKIPYSGDWLLSFSNVTLLSKNVGLAGIFKGGPIIAEVLHIDGEGLNKIIILVKGMTFGDDVVKSNQLKATYTRDTKQLEFEGDAKFNILNKQFNADFVLGVDTDGHFTNGGIIVKSPETFDIIPGKVALKDPELFGTFFKNGFEVGGSGSLELKLIDGLDIAAQTIRILYNSKKGFVGSLEHLSVDIRITDNSYVRFELFDAEVSKGGFKAKKVKLTYAYDSTKKESGDESQEVSEKPTMNKSSITSLLPGFDPSWIGGSLETLVVEASASGVSITGDKGLQSDDTSKRLVKFGAKLFGISASFDGDKGEGKVEGSYGPKELTLPSPQLHFPVVPGLYAGLGITSKLGFQADMSGTLTRGEPIDDHKTKWAVGGLARAQAYGSVEFAATMGIGDPIVVALQGELFANAKAALKGGAGLKGVVIFDDAAVSVTPSRDDKVRADFMVSGNLTASLGARLRARALYVFSAKLYEVHFKEWQIGKFQFSGQIGHDKSIKVHKPTFNGEKLPKPPVVEDLELTSLQFLRKMEKDKKIRIKDPHQMYRLLHDIHDPDIPKSVLSEEDRWKYHNMLGKRNDSGLDNVEDTLFKQIQSRTTTDGGVRSYMMTPKEWIAYSTTKSKFGGVTDRSSIKMVDAFVEKYHKAVEIENKISILDVLLYHIDQYESKFFSSRKPMTRKLRFDAIKELKNLKNPDQVD